MTAVTMSADEWAEVEYLDPLPETHADRVRALIDWYENADTESVRLGREWYRVAQREAIRLARKHGTTQHRAAGILAAFSQNASWKANRTLADRYLGGTKGGLPKVLAECDRIMSGEGPLKVLGHIPKVREFYRAIVGHGDALAMDRWAMQAAYMRRVPQTAQNMADAREAYREAAMRCGEDPRDIQAIIWIEARGAAF